ncbi:MAG: YdeI/OmpD-associated family protein [Pseudonocardia sediminis]
MTTFRTTVELAGKTATGFEVPDAVVAELGSGKRPAVTVTVGGHSYPSTVAVMGGRYLVPLSAENRTAAGLTAGDEVDVELVLDTSPRELVVPDDLAAAIAADPAAQAFFDALSYSNKRRHTLAVEGAKTDATRQRRIAKAVEDLRAGRK